MCVVTATIRIQARLGEGFEEFLMQFPKVCFKKFSLASLGTNG